MALFLGPLLFFVVYNLPFEIISGQADKVLAVSLWMIVWWMSEVVSISVTALIPLVVFPILGISDMTTTAANYGSPIVFLFFGGFVMALALEKVGLHRRIALNIVRFTGSGPNRVLLGFMIATASLSMWISNTATTVVMLPIALSVIELLKNDDDGFTQGDKNFAISIMLGIAFSANVGGIATIIGTPPNTVLVGFLEKTYGLEISFLDWIFMGLPFSVIMLFVIYFVLVLWIYPNQLTNRSDTNALIKKEIKKLGPIKIEEKRVLLIFFLTISLWVFRNLINDFFNTYSESPYVPNVKLSDAGISLLAAFSLFTWPLNFNKGKFSLDWSDTRKLPWGILILFGGGLALAKTMADNGVIDYIGQLVSSNNQISWFMVTLILVTVILFMTELLSNVALVAIFAPVIAGIALGLNGDKLELLIPTTMAASCAFMLPMATPPNAIVFASGYLKVSEMTRAGIVLNIISIALILLFAQFWIPYVMA